MRVQAPWKVHAVLRLVYYLPLAAYCLAATAAGQYYSAPGCTPLLQGAAYDSSSFLYLDGGSCYSCATSTSTPCLTVPVPQGPLLAANTTNTKAVWLPTPQSGQQPVLDLCNQVQSIWVSPGALQSSECGVGGVL